MTEPFSYKFVIAGAEIGFKIRKLPRTDFSRAIDVLGEVACAENMINAMVFKRCPIYRNFEFGLSRVKLFRDILGGLR